ncbi:MAG: DUF4347 domain-containing protein, partial [Betaproteobacteria bacterium]
MIEQIEPRILYSADLNPVLVNDPVVAPQIEHRVIDANGEFNYISGSVTLAQTRHEIAFVDVQVEDYQQIVDDINRQNTDQRQIEVVLIDARRDGIDQIGEVLQGRHDIDAVHIFSHGVDGGVELGSAWLNALSLEARADAIAQWGTALSANADILLYGCDVAQDAAGRALVDALSRLTGADVAASVDLTGNSSRGGDWDLEYNVGQMETALAVSPATQQTWQGLLDITTGLKGLWTLDANANDTSGNGYNGTLTNGAAIDTNAGTNMVGAGKVSVDGVND